MKLFFIVPISCLVSILLLNCKTPTTVEMGEVSAAGKNKIDQQFQLYDSMKAKLPSLAKKFRKKPYRTEKRVHTYYNQIPCTPDKGKGRKPPAPKQSKGGQAAAGGNFLGIQWWGNQAPKQSNCEKRWSNRQQRHIYTKQEKVTSTSRVRIFNEVISLDEYLEDIRPKSKITSREKRDLRRDQNRRIAQAKTEAKRRSNVDLDRYRKIRDKSKRRSSIQSFCRALPKGAMLHNHSIGMLDRDNIKTLLEKYNPEIRLNSKDHYPYNEIYENKRPGVIDRFFLRHGKKYDFSDFDGVIERLRDLREYPGFTREMYRMIAKRAKDHNVMYLELSENVKTQRSRDPRAYKNLEEIIEDLEKETGVTLRLIKSFYRGNQGSTLYQSTRDLLDSKRKKFIVGIDLLGDERLSSAFEAGMYIYPLVRHANDPKSDLPGKGYKMTIHAGELGDKFNPIVALVMGVDRIGHGVLLWDDVVATEYAVHSQTPVVANLTSNLLLSPEVKDIENHPFLNFLRLGIKVSLSTDDEGIFKTTISDECVLAVEETDITYFELKQMSFNSIDSSFADRALKDELRNRLKASFRTFEANLPR